MTTIASVSRSIPKKIRESLLGKGMILISPTLIYLLIFLAIPLALVVVLSFMTRGTYGNIVYQFNLQNYVRLLDPIYFRILGYSISTAGLTTIICLLIAYPLAYFIARVPERQRSLFLFLILVPFWTNFIIRIYAWIMILRSEGLLNSFLLKLGLIQAPLDILYTPTAVLIGMVYEFLPFMVLPLYSSLEKMDLSQLEAAADLGARPWQAFLRVTLPVTIPGIVAGSILTFIPAMGMFVIPDLMGGAKTMLVGNLIRNQFLTARNWPFGAAASMVLLVGTLILVLVYTRKTGFGEENLLV